MPLFLLSFFVIYGAVNAYCLSKAGMVIKTTGLRRFYAFIFIALMVAMPVMTRLLEKAGIETGAMFSAYLGYGWMGFIFLFFSLSLFFDVIIILSLPLNRFIALKKFQTPFRRRNLFWVTLVLSVTACLYGVFEAENIRVEKITLQTDKLPPGTDTFRIIQISDVHLGLIVRQRKLERIVEMIKKERPDILVNTGDLVDGQIARRNGLTEVFQTLQPPFGKYAVSGNHEYYAGISQSSDFIRKSGFTLLAGEKAQPDSWLTLIGIDDRDGINDTILQSLDDGKFILALKHRPTAISTDQVIDLQLSGHIHQGQIFPFNFITKIAYPAPAGLSFPDKNSALYVSRGTGTWGPPIRVFSPPEITVIDLIKK